jgi:hypothetical protein
LNFCGIVALILKMATGRNFSMSGINSGHHYLPNYQILMISDNAEFLPPILMPCLADIRSPFSKWPSQYRKKSSSEFVTMQSVHLNLLSVAGLGDVIIVIL